MLVQTGAFYTARWRQPQTLPPKPHCAPNKREIKKAVLIQLAFHFVAGDLYPLATDSDSLENGPLTLKSVSL